MFTAGVRSVCSLLESGQCVHCWSPVSVFTVGVRSVCSLLESGQCVHCWSPVSVFTAGVRSVCSLLESGQCVHCWSPVSVFTVGVRSVCSLLECVLTDRLLDGKGGRPFVFRISSHEGQVMELAADSEAELNDWMASIRSCTSNADTKVGRSGNTSRRDKF